MPSNALHTAMVTEYLNLLFYMLLYWTPLVDGEDVAVAEDEVVYEIVVDHQEAGGSGIPKPSFNHNYEEIEHEEDILNCNTPQRRIQPSVIYGTPALMSPPKHYFGLVPG